MDYHFLHSHQQVKNKILCTIISSTYGISWFEFRGKQFFCDIQRLSGPVSQLGSHF